MADSKKKPWRAPEVQSEPMESALGGLGKTLFGGVATGLVAGLTAKQNERALFAAAALQGMLSREDGDFDVVAAEAQGYADALLKRLAAVPDPRTPEEKEPS